MYTSVLVGLDLGGPADRSLPVAHALARRIGARLDVVVVSTPGVDPDADEREVRAHAKASGVAVDAVRLRYEEDVAAGILAEAASDDSLLCLAPRPRGAITEKILGRTTSDVLRRTTDPVLLVGPQAITLPPPSFGAVLACIEGGRGADQVADIADRWAAELDADMHVVAIEPDVARAGRTERRRSEAPHVTSRPSPSGVRTSWEVTIVDRPEELILATAAQMDGPVIVVGNDTSSAQGPAVGDLGSTLVQDALFPVLVAPDHQNGSEPGDDRDR